MKDYEEITREEMQYMSDTGLIKLYYIYEENCNKVLFNKDIFLKNSTENNSLLDVAFYHKQVFYNELSERLKLGRDMAKFIRYMEKEIYLAQDVDKTLDILKELKERIEYIYGNSLEDSRDIWEEIYNDIPSGT